jgi:hypothetical protein
MLTGWYQSRRRMRHDVMTRVHLLGKLNVLITVSVAWSRLTILLSTSLSNVQVVHEIAFETLLE